MHLMTRQQPYRPSVRKRVLLTLYLVLPFLVLALLMYVLAYQLKKQGAEIRDDTPIVAE